MPLCDIITLFAFEFEVLAQKKKNMKMSILKPLTNFNNIPNKRSSVGFSTFP